MTAFTTVQRTGLGALAVWVGACGVLPAQAQNYPVLPVQRATAQQVAQRGVPLAELAPNAPETYVVQRGDTLWGISGMYLQRPWRWPELWGMNLQAIANPHLIYPGQTLRLVRDGDFVRLVSGVAGEPETVRVSPRIRSESLADIALPTLKPHLIEPYLTEPLVVDAQAMEQAPRIVATLDSRVLMASGDRAYVRGDAAAPLRVEPGSQRQFRVFRDATPLKDPVTGEILGYEARYLGKALLVRGESFEETADGKGGRVAEYVPATVELSGTKEEIRAGDRLLPPPERTFVNYVPHAPAQDVDARVVSIYGHSALAYAAQNQVVALNLGTQDGMEVGHVLHLLSTGERVKDSTDPAKAMIRLPSERNGTALVFRTFERVSYALILEIRNGVRVGDRLINPQ
ncbi:MAG: LysM domain-containing protein [Burkholderiaceae bacterium]|nr:LysM domain-containing protein [Burkholderiaceae bacterium]